MSLILEALRKSEQQRRLGEVPTLDSESAWATRRWHGTPARGARWPWLAALAVLALAGVAGWWFLGPRGDAAPDAAGDSAAQAAPQAPAAAAPVAPAPSASQPAQSAPPPADAAAASLPPPSRRPIAPPAALPATPAPLLPSTASMPPLDAPTPAVDGEYPDAAPATDAVAPPSAAPLPAAASQAPPPPVDAAPPAPAPAAVAPDRAAATPPPAATASGDVPLVYTLPLATRQALPALKLSMHVWNADPARRFVIIGETRAAEGEPAGTDLRVVEIRREGVVLEFKGTVFLLPRGGW